MTALQPPTIATSSYPADTTRGVGRRLRLGVVWLYWILALAYCALAAWQMLPINYRSTAVEWSVQQAYSGVASWLTYAQWVQVVTSVELLVAGVMVGTALLIVWLRPRDWVAVIISATLLLLAIVLGIHGNQDTLRWPAWLRPWQPQILAFVIAGFSAGIFTLLLLFPNGRLAPGWAGRTGAATALLLLGVTLAGLFTPLWSMAIAPRAFLLYAATLLIWLLRTPGSRLTDWTVRLLVALLYLLVAAWAVGLIGSIPEGDTWSTIMSLLLVGLAAGLISQWQRYRFHSTPREQQQTRWVVVGLTAALGALLLSIPIMLLVDIDRLPPMARTAYTIFQSMAVLALPLSLALALLRDGLWDVEAVFSRAIVYVLLTGSVLVAYIITVGAVSLVLGRQSSVWAAIVATGLAALLVHPLRMRLQAVVNRLIYGERDDPVTVLQRLGHQLETTLEPEAALHALTETVARSLKLPYVALEVAEIPTPLAAWGEPVGVLERFPLVYQGATLGALLAAGRSERERLSPADRRLLENVAMQAGPAVQAQQLGQQLLHSRQAIVLAREEERRRLRRELHDGLGPMLASQMLTLDVIGRHLEDNPAMVTSLVHDMKRHTQDAVRDIRRMVYDLRPPALDDLGLSEALRQLAQQLSWDKANIALVIIGSLTELPAAVEVAAYRIAQEALTNAVRHAQPTCVTLSLRRLEGVLHIQVDDDGSGISAGAPVGVGILSMRERAAELGGTLALFPRTGGGTSVCATLPCG